MPQNITGKIENIMKIIICTSTVLTIFAGVVWATIDWRIDKKQAPIVKELVFLNCMFRVSLTPEQQQEAESLYRQVSKIGEK